jgi:hypothetical protein
MRTLKTRGKDLDIFGATAIQTRRKNLVCNHNNPKMGVFMGCMIRNCHLFNRTRWIPPINQSGESYWRNPLLLLNVSTEGAFHNTTILSKLPDPLLQPL